MKKTRKRKHRAAKPKGRPKQKQLPKARKRVDASVSEVSSEISFSGGFDFTSPAAPADNLATRARDKLRAGKPDQALALCREALAANPGDAQALNLTGIACFQTGKPEEALDVLKTAVAFSPDDPEIRTNLGNVLAALGQIEEAEFAYQDALKADPEYGEAAFNHGVLLETTGRRADALTAYQRALEITPDHAAARLGLGNVLRAMDRLDAARIAYQAALKHNPALAEARINLAAVLQELGDFEAAAEQCRQALETAPEMTEAHYNLGIALQEMGHYEEANAAYGQVLADNPDHAAAALNIGYGLQQTGRLKEAASAFSRALEIDSEFAKAAVNLADLRLQQGNPDKALGVCDAFLEHDPGNTALLAFRALVLSDLGDQAAARNLIDFDRFLQPVTIAPPAGYDSLAAFNAALCDHVLAHPTLTFAPQSHATREGRHSGELLSEPRGPVAALEEAIREAADAYRTTAGRDPGHPFLARPPETLTLSVWGVVMQRSGHQIPHIHPAAWLSGVYYASLPDVVGEGGSDKAGWIEFGRPPDHFHNRTTPETCSIRPEPGLMVLFPSYFYHHTVPFEADGTRVSIAFDLMPG